MVCFVLSLSETCCLSVTTGRVDAPGNNTFTSCAVTKQGALQLALLLSSPPLWVTSVLFVLQVYVIFSVKVRGEMQDSCPAAWYLTYEAACLTACQLACRQRVQLYHINLPVNST